MGGKSNHRRKSSGVSNGNSRGRHRREESPDMWLGEGGGGLSSWQMMRWWRVVMYGGCAVSTARYLGGKTVSPNFFGYEASLSGLLGIFWTENPKAYVAAEDMSSATALEKVLIELERMVVHKKEYEDALALAQEAIERNAYFGEKGNWGLAALQYWKGRALLGLPVNRCEGGSCPQHAAASLAEAVRLGPKDGAPSDSKRWLLTATTDLRGIDATKPQRVAALFDQYAHSFEEHLTKHLGYSAPIIIAQAMSYLASSTHIEETSIKPKKHLARHENPFMNKQDLAAIEKDSSFSQVLHSEQHLDTTYALLNFTIDVGCGTGLVADELRAAGLAPQGRSFIYGLDLSPAMIEQARAKHGLYDDLSLCDARKLAACVMENHNSIRYLHKHIKPDLITFADVLVYTDDHDVEAVLAQAALLSPTWIALTVERPDRDVELLLSSPPELENTFAFDSTEPTTQNNFTWKCILGATGRYSHNLAWLLSHMYTAHHYELAWIGELCDSRDCPFPPLRFENGKPVRGAVVIFSLSSKVRG